MTRNELPMDLRWLWRFRRTWSEMVSAPVPNYDPESPLHLEVYPVKGLAYEYEPEPSAADRARWLSEIEREMEKENEPC